MADTVRQLHSRTTAALEAALAAALAAARTGGLFDLDGWQGDIDMHVAPVVAAQLADARMLAAGMLGGIAGSDMFGAGWDTEILDAVSDLGIALATKLATPGADVDAVWQAADGLAANVASLAAQAVNAIMVDAADQAALAPGGQTPASATWNTMGDDRVRPDHADAEGMTVDYGDTFLVGGEDLAYPGDPDGSPDNTYGCRCWLTFEDADGNDMADTFAASLDGG